MYTANPHVRSGSAADTQAIADMVHYYLQMFQYVPPKTPPLFSV